MYQIAFWGKNGEKCEKMGKNVKKWGFWGKNVEKSGIYLHFGHSQLSKLLIRAQVLGPWLHHSDDFVRGRHGKYFNSGDSSNTN
jgi:hypothetical protein